MKPEKYSRGDTLRVLWVDSAQTPGWVYEAEPPVNIEEAVTCGYFVNSSNEGINMTTTLSDGGGALNLIAIPWSAIREIQQIFDWGRYEVPPN